MTISFRELLADADRPATYARLRAEGAVHPGQYVDGTPIWFVTRFAEARAVLADPRLICNSAKHGRINVAAANALPPETARYFTGNMLDRDPPEHTRLRRLISRAFTARRIEGLRPQVERLTADIFDDLVGAGETDLVEWVADRLPIRVICDLLGVPSHQRDGWARHARGLTSMGPEAIDAAIGLVDLAQQLIALKADGSGDDLVAELIRINRTDDERLTDDELVTTVITLLGTGHEATVQLIASSLFAVLAYPDQASLLRREPALIPGAVEEFLRYFTPFEVAGLRFTDEPVRIGEVDLPAGEVVQVVLHAANRDPAAFVAADRIDVTRSDVGGHLAFGHGIHYCLGAALGRMQAEIAVGALLSRFPVATLAVAADRVPWRTGLISGPARLPAVLAPSNTVEPPSVVVPSGVAGPSGMVGTTTEETR